MRRRMSMTDYRFVGDVNQFDTRILVRLTRRRFETDMYGNAYVVAQVLMGVATHPVELTMTLEQAFAADLIEKG